MVLQIPQNKLKQVKSKLLHIKGKPKVTLKRIQQLVGLLNFCAKAIPSVCAFNRRFCDAMCGVKKQSHHIRVSVEMKEDINMWLYNLDRFNNTCYLDKKISLTNKQLNIYTISQENLTAGLACFIPDTVYSFYGLSCGRLKKLCVI